MFNNNDTPCGCRSNSANDTRGQTSAAVDGVDSLDSGDDRFEGGTFGILCGFISRLDRRISLLEGALLPGNKDFHVGFKAHVSSPVVAESGAVTPDAPAMTVQEGGGSESVAPGVGDAPSPASSTPRFVAVGARVYDRHTDRISYLKVSSLVDALVLAERLNAGHKAVELIKWEDAK